MASDEGRLIKSAQEPSCNIISPFKLVHHVWTTLLVLPKTKNKCLDCTTGSSLNNALNPASRSQSICAALCDNKTIELI